MRRYKVIFVLRIRYSGLFLFLCVWCRMRGWLVFYFINFNIYIQEYIVDYMIIIGKRVLLLLSMMKKMDLKQ